MARPYKLGENAKLYWSATATATMTYVIPATIADNVSNVQVSGKTDTPEYTTRGNNGVKQYASSLKDLTVTLEIKVPAVDGDDDAYTAIRDAWIAGDEIAVYALNDLKTVTGAEGPAGNFVVSDFSRDESNGKVLFAKVELKPSSFNSWHVIAGS